MEHKGNLQLSVDEHSKAICCYACFYSTNKGRKAKNSKYRRKYQACSVSHQITFHGLKSMAGNYYDSKVGRTPATAAKKDDLA